MAWYVAKVRTGNTSERPSAFWAAGQWLAGFIVEPYHAAEEICRRACVPIKGGTGQTEITDCPLQHAAIHIPARQPIVLRCLADQPSTTSSYPADRGAGPRLARCQLQGE